MIEKWKWHPDYVGCYKISNRGRVKSVARTVIRGSSTLSIPGRLRKQQIDHSGYLVVTLRKDGKSRTRKVHQLVLEAFSGKRPSPKHEVRHLDGNQLNNELKNLKWGTRLENSQDRIQHGTQFSGVGEDNPRAILTEIEVRKIWKRIQKGADVEILADKYGVSKSNIRNIANGLSWNQITGLPKYKRKVGKRDNITGPRRT